jgi:hypothetical protein
MNAHPDPQDLQAHKDPKENQEYLAQRDPKVLKVRLDQLENKVLQDHLELRAHKGRLDLLENQALLVSKGLQDLLDRLGNVIANAKLFWFTKTTLLRWMIIILALIVMDRLLLHFPQILQAVMKLL